MTAETALRFVVLTDAETAPGFLLAGAEAREATPASCGAVLEELLGDSEVGLVALNERFLPHLSPALHGRVEESALPLGVPFPSPGGVAENRGEEYLTALIRRAVGYSIRLRT